LCVAKSDETTNNLHTSDEMTPAMTTALDSYTTKMSAPTGINLYIVIIGVLVFVCLFVCGLASLLQIFW